jgi:AcrR family transcriptional regulator
MKHHSDRDGRQKILAVAEDLFIEQGYNAVSIRDIAERCDVTNAALYYHFPSKMALFAEVLEHHAKRVNDRMQLAYREEGSYREKLTRMLLEYANMIKDRRPPFHLLHLHIEGMDRKTKMEYIRSLVYATILPIEALLKDAILAGELKTVPGGYSAAALLVGMVNGQMQYAHACGNGVIGAEEVKFIVDLFWDGLHIGDQV